RRSRRCSGGGRAAPAQWSPAACSRLLAFHRRVLDLDAGLEREHEVLLRRHARLVHAAGDMADRLVAADGAHEAVGVAVADAVDAGLALAHGVGVSLE